MAGQPSYLIVVGASAGGVEALRDFVTGLESDLPAAVLVVLHLPPGGSSALPAILSRAGTIPAVAAEQRMRLAAGTVYAAVPDHHLLVSDGRVLLSRGPTENGHRPGVDALFRSAALEWGPRAVGVVLSGSLDDGTAGLIVIKSQGGLAVVQDPQEALYRSMPENALTRAPVDVIAPARKIGVAVAEGLRARPVGSIPSQPSGLDRLEVEIDAGVDMDSEQVTRWAQPSGLICPDCGGALFSLAEATRYRCRVGHAWSAEALLLEQNAEIDKALWTAVRVLEEKRQLADRMRVDAERRGQDLLAARYCEQQSEHAHAGAVLRQLLDRRNLH
ncbi:chemotaxis protein CheB [Nocardia brasiliensis]|uniref:chemotaxis protein CheB n=1 Tax=Nocardia brasiliensis TaxID=37326 RepID=UPI0036709942